MTSRCPVPGVPLTPGDQAEVDRFAAFLRDPDPNRGAAYLRHYADTLPPVPLPQHFTSWVHADLARHAPEPTA